MTSTVKTQARLWVGIYLVATLGTGLLAKTSLLPGWLSMSLFIASFLLLLPMAKAVERRQAECGLTSRAMGRYNRRVLTASMFYIVLLLGGMTLAHQFDLPVAIRVLLAMLVALPVMGIIWAMAQLLREETDEYLRAKLVEQSLFATGFLLTIATLYGFLNAFDVAPRIDAWAAVPAWAIGLGLAHLVRRDPSC